MKVLDWNELILFLYFIVLLPSIPFPPENHTCPVDDDVDDDGGLVTTDVPSTTMVAVVSSLM